MADSVQGSSPVVDEIRRSHKLAPFIRQNPKSISVMAILRQLLQSRHFAPEADYGVLGSVLVFGAQLPSSGKESTACSVQPEHLLRQTFLPVLKPAWDRGRVTGNPEVIDMTQVRMNRTDFFVPVNRQYTRPSHTRNRRHCRWFFRALISPAKWPW